MAAGDCDFVKNYILASPVFLAASMTAAATTLAMRLSSAVGIMFFAESYSSGISDASAKDAATFISSFMLLARQSSAPLNIPGNASTLFI